MDSTQAAHQIQALTTSVNELIQQNSELRQIVEAQSNQRNEERHKNNNEHHRRTRASEENSSRMDELKSAMKGKVMENLDGMIRRTDSPFTTEVLNRPLPTKFCLPQLESYDGSKDPLDHIESFKTLMHLHMTPDKVMCKAFPTTLKGVARVWFNKIPPSYHCKLWTTQ